MDMMCSCVDASYATHEEMKGHTGGLMILGRGIIQGNTAKQK